MKDAYEKARHSGERAFRKALLAGQYPYLTDLDYVLSHRPKKTEVIVGKMEIPLKMITGTKNQMRGESFACNFMPLLEYGTEFAAKWTALLEAQETEGIRDPVKVYEYLHRFYVAEGNKRVSVLRYLGAPAIDAEIIRILPEKSDEPEIRLYYEFLDFFAKAPIYELQFSKESSYRKLEKLIGMEDEDVWPEKMVLDLKGAFADFEAVYTKKTLYRMEASDAFLVFLTYFPMSQLLESTTAEIGKMVDQVGTLYREKKPIMKRSGV